MVNRTVKYLESRHLTARPTIRQSDKCKRQVSNRIEEKDPMGTKTDPDSLKNSQ